MAKSNNITISLPTMHPDQVKAYLQTEDVRGGEWAKNSGGRFKAIRCGRRWGKTDLGKIIAGDAAAKGQYVFWAAPDYKTMSEAYEEILDILEPIKKSASKHHGVVRTTTGGRVDYWSLDNPRAGRSRKYHVAIIDEAAFTKPDMMTIWEQSIQPTLLDFNGRAFIVSNTAGEDPDNFFWRICNQPEHGFIEYHAPTINNPYVPMRKGHRDHNSGEWIWDETEEEHMARRLQALEDIRATKHPMVFSQEYLAEFVNWSGVAFFDPDKMLVDGQPVPMPARCDAIFAVIDSATKTGTDNDGTAVVWCARSRHAGHPLVILDWSLVQIEGALLEHWLPSVIERGQELAQLCGARGGFVGAFIEDKASGEILIQQARRRRLPVKAIESRLTALGKDERALSVSGYVYNGKVKICREAYDKTMNYKGATRNHLLGQIGQFRIGDKDAAKRADDALDAYVYSIALGLGDSGGF